MRGLLPIFLLCSLAAVAQGYGVQVGSIVHSGKKRARQTAEIFGAALSPAGGVKQMDGLKPLDDVTAVARNLRSDRGLMMVGHLPFMERLTPRTSHRPARFTPAPSSSTSVSCRFSMIDPVWPAHVAPCQLAL